MWKASMWMLLSAISVQLSVAGQGGADQRLDGIEVGPVKSHRVDPGSRPVESSSIPSNANELQVVRQERSRADTKPSPNEGLTEADHLFFYAGVPIHPSLLCEFLGYISDKGYPLTIAVDIAAAYKTNEYPGPVTKDADGTVVFENIEKNTVDKYRWYGRMADGSHVVYVWEDDGSRMPTSSLFFVSFSEGTGVKNDGAVYDRLLMEVTRWYLPFKARSKVIVSDVDVVLSVEGESIKLPSIDKAGRASREDIVRAGLMELKEKFTFGGKPVHPGIIQEYTGYLSDRGFPISVTMDIAAAADSNEYFDGDVKKTQKGILRVDLENREEFFSYQWCGGMADDIQVVRTFEGGSGSGIFQNLYFLKLESGRGYKPDGSAYSRLLMTAVRWFPLGDRSNAEVHVFNDRVVVGPGIENKDPITLTLTK